MAINTTVQMMQNSAPRSSPNLSSGIKNISSWKYLKYVGIIIAFIILTFGALLFQPSLVPLGLVSLILAIISGVLIATPDLVNSVRLSHRQTNEMLRVMVDLSCVYAVSIINVDKDKVASIYTHDLPTIDQESAAILATPTLRLETCFVSRRISERTEVRRRGENWVEDYLNSKNILYTNKVYSQTKDSVYYIMNENQLTSDQYDIINELGSKANIYNGMVAEIVWKEWSLEQHKN